MNNLDIAAAPFKFMSSHRDDIYEPLAKNERTCIMFSNKSDTMMVAFAIGFHVNGRKKPGEDGKAINHVNLTSFPMEAREVIIALVQKRHPEAVDADILWHLVEEYAEYGIVILNESIKRNNDLIIDDILGRIPR